MVTFLVITNWLLPLFYLSLLIDYGATFFLRVKAQARNPWLLPVLCFHVLFIVLRGVHLGRPPLAGVYEIISLLALSTAVVYTVVEFAGRDRRTGMFVFLLVFLLQYTSSNFLATTFAAAQDLSSDAQSSWTRLHIVPALLAYTSCAIAAVYGLLHLLAQRGLKQHHFGLLFDRLPPLDLLGRMSWYALLGGLLFMTVTIATGPFLFSHSGHVGQTGLRDAKVLIKIIIGSIAWLIYAVAVLGKFFGKWPPSRVSGIAVAGFVVIMALLIVSGILS